MSDIYFYVIYVIICYVFKLFLIKQIKFCEIIKLYIVSFLLLWFIFVIGKQNVLQLISIHLLMLSLNLFSRKIYYKFISSKIIYISKEENSILTESMVSYNFKQYNIKVSDVKIFEQNNNINKSIVIFEDIDINKIENLFSYVNNNDVYIKFNYKILPFYKGKLFLINDMPYIKINKLSIPSYKLFIKRIIDIIVSLVLLIFLFPINVIIAVLIKITSPGSIIYKQERITIAEKKFAIYKFRSMYENSEKNGIPQIAYKNDVRITFIGQFIRKFKIDEIPQLINVLKGKMSLIGPRPEREYYINKYKKTIPYYNLRHTVKAGITGLGHIYGNYYTSPEYRYIYDLYYIMNYSLYNDLKIAMGTIFKIILAK